MLKHILIPLVARRDTTKQLANTPLERINAMWHWFAVNPARVWHVYSTATGTCRSHQLPHINAHPLHYSPGPYGTGCFLGMKMWIWIKKGQVVSVIGIKLSFWKETWRFFFNLMKQQQQQKTQKKTITFPTTNRFGVMLIYLKTFMVKRCRTLEKNMSISLAQKPWGSCQWLLGQILFLLLGIWSLPRMWQILGG